jgi:hypothetical protein
MRKPTEDELAIGWVAAWGIWGLVVLPLLYLHSGSLGDIGVLVTAVATIAIACFTRALKRSTDKLWEAGERQLAHLEDTAVRQLRAYIFPQHTKLMDFDSNPLVQIIFKNSGQTPAYDTTLWATVAVAKYPLETAPERPSGLNTESEGHVGPGGSFHIGGRCNPAMTANERAGVRAGVAAVYVVGEVAYRDAFDIPRFTKFCFVYGGPGGLHPEGSMASYRYWNDAN